MAQAQNRKNSSWEGPTNRPSDAKATELLNLYIYDYCKKKKFHQAARAFASDANVQPDQSLPYDFPSGFLVDWWNVFWDIYYAKSKEADSSREANIIDEYHNFLRAKREEVFQQQRAFNLQQAQQQQAQTQAQLQQRRSSEVQRVAQSPQLSMQQQQQQMEQQQQQTPHLQQPNVPSQQQQQGLSRDPRASPASSIASLPNNNSNNGMPPPQNNNAANNNNNNSNNAIVNTPQSIPATLPQQNNNNTNNNLPGRHPTASPSFSPQQIQRGAEIVPGNNNPPPNMHPEGIMSSPMVPQQMTFQQQQQMMSVARAQQQHAIVSAAMNAAGLAGRDRNSLTPEEQALFQAQIRKYQMQHATALRNNSVMANNPQLQARLQMQQQALLQQQQQQQQQQAYLQQQHLQQQQQQQQQQAQHIQQQGTPQMQHQQQGTPQLQHQPQQGTSQQQQQQIPQQQQHPLQSPQVDAAHRLMGPGGPNVNGQPRPHMIGPGGQISMSPNMQNPNLMNGMSFNGDMNLMLAQNMMNKGQIPNGLTPQQHQQMLAQQQQQRLLNHKRMVQQQQMAQQQALQHAQQQQHGPPQQQQPHPQNTPQLQHQQQQQQPTPQQQHQQIPPGAPQTPPNVNSIGSPNATAGSPEGGDKKKIAVALYQRRQVSHVLQQQQQVQAQQQAQQQQQNQPTPPQGFNHPGQKRQRVNMDDSITTTQAPPSPQLHHKASPRSQHQQVNPNESPILAMQQRLAQQQRSQFEQQKMSPQMSRSVANTPQQQSQQLQQRMPWNSDMESPLNDAQSPTAMNNGMNPNMANNNVLSFDLERFLGDSGDFGEMFASGDENNDQNLMMSGDGTDLDPFGGGFLASMGGGLDLDNGMNNGSASHAMNMSGSLHPYANLSGHGNKVATASFSVDGQWLASAGHDRKVMIWSVQEKKPVYTLDGHTANITCARWSLDSRNLVATSSYDKTIRVWDIGAALNDVKDELIKKEEDSKSVDKVDMAPKQLVKLDCRAQVTAVDFAPDRPDTICSLDAEGELKVWNLNTSNCEKSLKITQSKSGFSPNPMRFHPRTTSILACAVANQIYIIDITAIKGNDNSIGVRTIASDHNKNIGSFDWSADGSFLVASSEDKISVYETSHWKCVMNHLPQSKVSGCAFIHGGNEKLRLLYGGYQEIYLWQCTISGSQPRKVGTQLGTVVSIANHTMSNGQTLIATASHSKEKNLVLWTI